MKQNPVHTLLQRKQAAIMAIINVTPDSFSDGGNFLQTESALKHALKMAHEGADILDIGGESTRPGAQKVSLQQELDRVIPTIESIALATDIPISIDTSKPQVMQAAVAAGASMINDVRALRFDKAVETAANLDVPVCFMHMGGSPDTMQNAPSYNNVVDEVFNFLSQRIDVCERHGLSKENIMLDPGIGFGKTLQHNLKLLKAIPKFNKLGAPVLVGISKKSMIDDLLQRPVNHRMPASIGLAVQSVLNGAKIVRVHDVQATYDAVRCAEAVAFSDLR